MAQLDLDDAVHVRPGQPIKDDGLIKTVEEFGPEMRPHRIHDIPLCRAGICAVGQLAERLRPEVRRQNDQGLFEINRPALAIGQLPVIQHLKQHVEHIRMRFFDLIEQHDLIGPTAHRLGQNTALIIANIARRRTDQARNRMLFHEL